MIHARVLLVVALLPAIAACAPKPSAPTLPTTLGTGPAVATVNGTAIGQDFYNYYVKRATNGKTPADLTPEQRNQVLDELIRLELLAQQAVPKEGLDTETQQLLALAQMNVLDQIANAKKVPKPTEQELRETYEKMVVTSAPKVEYHVRHIELATEAFAQKIIERLDKGEKFEELAKRESMDEGTKNSGGELPWFTTANVEPAMGEAIANLKKGEFTHSPVRTNQSWHVVQLIDTRDAAPPPSFENVRPRLEQFLEQRKLQTYTDELMRSAKIEKTLEPKGSGSASSTKSSSSSSSSDKK